MKGYIDNIERKTEANTDFRHVLYTGKHSQLVLMCLLPNEEIGLETHTDTDQFFRVESGAGQVVIDGVSHSIADGDAIIVPEGARHNIINTSSTESLRLYTLYAPAHHKEGTIQHTKSVAEASKEHFDGITTE